MQSSCISCGEMWKQSTADGDTSTSIEFQTAFQLCTDPEQVYLDEQAELARLQAEETAKIEAELEAEKEAEEKEKEKERLEELAKQQQEKDEKELQKIESLIDNSLEIEVREDTTSPLKEDKSTSQPDWIERDWWILVVFGLAFLLSIGVICIICKKCSKTQEK